jgi:type I restriction enzyme S subunit
MSVISSENQVNTNSSNDAELPEGWAIVSLEEISTAPQYGWTTSADKDNNDLKLLRTTDISKGSVDWSTVPGCKKKPDNLSKYLLSPGDIVISRAGSVGLSYVVKECPESIFASYLIRFRALSPIDSNFIGLYLKSPQYWSAIADETAGIAIPNVNASKLKKLEIPLPPLNEQKRIVAKVEELLRRVNMVRERLAKVKEILKRFRQSVLAAAFTGRLSGDNCDNLPKSADADQLASELWEARKMWSLEVSEKAGLGKATSSKIKYSEVLPDEIDFL